MGVWGYGRIQLPTFNAQLSTSNENPKPFQYSITPLLHYSKHLCCDGFAEDEGAVAELAADIPKQRIEPCPALGVIQIA